MIPKVIHYCWFGGNELPESARRCIESWKRYCPEYEIKEWNESNFDVQSCDYVREAYEAKRWAFVSDYARFWVLHNYGGLYFDTDVEVVAPMDDILESGPYMGMEKTLSGDIAVNPGLGFAAEPGMELLGELLLMYSGLQFRNADGSLNQTTIVKHTTDMLLKYGYINEDKLQQCAGFQIYPVEYFCPLDYRTGRLAKTAYTRTIHHYASTWHTWKDKWIRLKRVFFSEAQIRKISAFLDRFRKRA
jgi:mannosyltransferase OCH1-like enzyme